MAGVKGKSGGPRANSGGVRVGAGRKKAVEGKSANPPAEKVLPMAGTDMLKFLQDVALGYTEASTVQVRAAIAAVQYTHTKRGDGGKKDETDEKAKKAAGGRFSAAAPPKLVVNNKQ